MYMKLGKILIFKKSPIFKQLNEFVLKLRLASFGEANVFASLTAA